MDRKVSGQSSLVQSVSATQQILSVGLLLTIWFISRWIFGAGLAGSDDSFYVRYAQLMHRGRSVTGKGDRSSFGSFALVFSGSATPSTPPGSPGFFRPC